MICDICGVRDAMVMVQQVSNSEKREVRLCIQCAARRGLSSTNGKIEMSLAGLFDSIAKAKKQERFCPVCGTSNNEIPKKQRLGCPECYNIFASELRQVLEEKGITGTYTGSMPERLANFKSVLVDRMQLRVKLEQSVEQEEYEKAAMYRDRLRALDKCAVTHSEIDIVSQGDGEI